MKKVIIMMVLCLFLVVGCNESKPVNSSGAVTGAEAGKISDTVKCSDGEAILIEHLKSDTMKNGGDELLMMLSTLGASITADDVPYVKINNTRYNNQDGYCYANVTVGMSDKMGKTMRELCNNYGIAMTKEMKMTLEIRPVVENRYKIENGNVIIDQKYEKVISKGL